MQEQELCSLTIGVIDPAAPRDTGGWTGAEAYRTQGFFKAGPAKIDEEGRLGQWRNLTTDLSAKRGADGTITGEWRLSIDLHVRGRRFERNDAISLVIRNGSAIIYSAVLPGFAAKCTGSWVTLTWNGPLSGELIFAQNTIELSSRGDQPIRRC